MNAPRPSVSGVARGARIGRAALQAGLLEAAERMSTARGGQWGAGATRALMAALLELRGAALKVAQFLSLESDLLPEPVAREFMRRCRAATAMSPDFTRDIVRARLGPVERWFASFDGEPFAAASLGQVHGATTLDGRSVAVKIQYPGIADTIRSDLRLLRNAASLLRERALYRHVLDEIEARLLEECDYVQEAQAQVWFRDRLRVPGVEVAGVLPRLSSRQLITFERLDGMHLDAWLETQPSQDVRDRAAQRLYDVFLHSMQGLGRLHGDPNPGNVLFQDDGRIGLLDFGCTRWLPAEIAGLVVRLWRSAIRGDEEAAHATYRDMGLFAQLSHAEAWRVDREFLRPFREWVAIPFSSERFDFANQPDFVAEGRRRFARLWREEALVGIRPEFVLVNRTLYGLYRLFERMGARVRCQTDWTSG